MTLKPIDNNVNTLLWNSIHYSANNEVGESVSFSINKLANDLVRMSISFSLYDSIYWPIRDSLKMKLPWN